MTQKFIPPVQRVDRGRYHFYTDGDGHKIPGVTTILGGGIPKPNLINWAANATAEGAVDNWDNLGQLKPAARLKELQGIRYERTNTAKNKGTKVHAYAEQLVQGKQVTGIEDELRPYTENYVKFIDAWKLDPIYVECVVVSYKHGYAGTLDLIGELTSPLSGEREVWLLDIKTGEKGVFWETALQLAAYRYAEAFIDANGDEQPMVPVQGTGAIHVTADDAVLIPTVSEVRQLNIFRCASKIYEAEAEKDGLMLSPMVHPNLSTAHVVWDEPR